MPQLLQKIHGKVRVEVIEDRNHPRSGEQRLNQEETGDTANRGKKPFPLAGLMHAAEALQYSRRPRAQHNDFKNHQVCGMNAAPHYAEVQCYWNDVPIHGRINL